jgi:hypothetical protein
MNRHRNAVRDSISNIGALFAHPQQTTIAFLINMHYVTCKASLSKAHGALTQMLMASNCDNSHEVAFSEMAPKCQLSLSISRLSS